MDSLTIPEFHPYIVGEEFTGECKDVRIDENEIELFAKLVAKSISASTSIAVLEHYTDFYNTEVDFRKQISPAQRANCFYAFKNGSYCLQIPPFCQYMVKKAWDMYKMPNMIVKVLPLPVLEKFFQEGYLHGGVTFRDVVCNVACEEYKPFSEACYTNDVGNCTELYIEREDMVALVPSSIAKALDIDTLKRVRKTEYGLAVDNILLRTMCGYTGGTNSTYDLRALI